MRTPYRLPGLLCLLAATAQAATGDWREDHPGRLHRIDPAAMPAPYQTPAAGNPPDLVDRPEGAKLSVPEGFSVQPFAELRGARVMRVAPNGDVFVSQTNAGSISVLHTQDGIGRALGRSVFASGLRQPYGIAFYPPRDPHYVYVGEIDRVIRYRWHVGASTPDGPAETVLDHLPTGGHWTRDVVVSADGSRLLISVGSGSNDAEQMQAKPPPGFVAGHALGAAWGSETDRADVLSIYPDGHDLRLYATGLRNCSGETIEPATGALWCATNERDGLGDDLPPDYLTHVVQGGYYGWPWYYIGNHPDPGRAKDRPDLAGRALVPDILIQPHSAPLGLTFYGGTLFPPAYRHGFAALHGSWNRGIRTGYKVVSFDPATNAVTDFLTGFVASNDAVWGRPVDVTTAHDGALLVSDDGGGMIWRVSH